MSRTQPVIVIVDFGSQYTQLIARRVRECGVYSEIHPYGEWRSALDRPGVAGVILSGGPASIYEPDAPRVERDLLDIDVPILGICYGLQVLTSLMGGRIDPAPRREFGRAALEIRDAADLFYGLVPESGSNASIDVWMSHGDRVTALPEGASVLACSANAPIAAWRDRSGRRFGIQFHPEVAHTPRGRALIENFLFRICRASASWTMQAFIEDKVREIREVVGDDEVIMALSGGVDSSVVAALLSRAIGPRVHPIFVDNGLLRRNEAATVRRMMHDIGLEIDVVDAAPRFLEALRGVEDPETKRKIIGHAFIAVFEEEAARHPRASFLAQGTLYPDVIESVSVRGPSATIKSHHNVGGLPSSMRLRLLEPLRELFKDEVRRVGLELGLPRTVVFRHPFPGPGLAVRMSGAVTPERIEILRSADEIVIEELDKSGHYDRVWQAFAVLLPVRSVGVMGDLRTFEYAIALRAVTGVDGMTADWARLPYTLLDRISRRIINEVTGVNRVVYDISSKPPSTIEWE